MTEKIIGHSGTTARLPLHDMRQAELAAMSNPFYEPSRISITIRIDADVMAWLRTQGKGIPSRINAILRQAMLASGES